VIQRQEFELESARKDSADDLNNPAKRSRAERLSETVDELRAFEAALEAVGARGFACPGLSALLATEEPDPWCCQTKDRPIPV
jgi:hypothetical protein